MKALLLAFALFALPFLGNAQDQIYTVSSFPEASSVQHHIATYYPRELGWMDNANTSVRGYRNGDLGYNPSGRGHTVIVLSVSRPPYRGQSEYTDETYFAVYLIRRNGDYRFVGAKKMDNSTTLEIKEQHIHLKTEHRTGWMMLTEAYVLDGSSIVQISNQCGHE